MAKLIAPPIDSVNIRSVHVTPISASSNIHAPSASRTTSLARTTSPHHSAPTISTAAASAPTLKALDKQHGPLRIGEIEVTRVELSALGATVDGVAISPANAGMQTPDQPFLDALNFESASVEARLKSVDNPDSGIIATLFYEIACKRSTDAPPLFVSHTALADGSAMQRLNQLGKAAQKLDIHRVDSFENTPGCVSKSKSYLMSGAGVGLQAFGIYSGYMGTIDAIKKGESLEAVYQGASIAAEFGSLIIEQGLTKTGQAMLRNGSTAFRRFPLTSAGKVLSRGAGLFASAITLPFDITDAVKSFNAAAASSGKQAQDHYVSGALSVTGAGISLILGVAALAGFGSTAGPIGLAAAAILITGSMIYQAARVVDDIDDYIELTTHERLRSGWFAFTGQELDKEVLDRFRVSKAFSEHRKQLQASAKTLIEGAYKDFVEQVVDGSFSVELRPVKVWAHQWKAGTNQPFKLESEPVLVENDDTISARDGVPANLPGVVHGVPGDKGVLWRLGDGNDKVEGVRKKVNLFSYREGAKTLEGGDLDDGFYDQVTEGELNQEKTSAPASTLKGGAGSDTLAFEGTRPIAATRHVGHDVNLQTGKVLLRSNTLGVDPLEIAQLDSIENISTLRSGTSHVTATDDANRIVANGNDDIVAGGGDDTIIIRGENCSVDGGPGDDRYYIAPTSAYATIIEDGEQPSVIELGWPMERIQRWQIIGTSLVIHSLRGIDGEDPPQTLTIKNVYRQVDGTRELRHSKLSFKTEDQYQLVPLLPALLNEPGNHAIEMLISAVGKPLAAPAIVNEGPVSISEKSAHRHYVSRIGRRVEFIATRETPSTSQVVFIDFKAEDIVDVIATYDVDKREGVSGNSHLYYSHINLSVLLPSKVVIFKGLIQTARHSTGYTGRNSLKVNTPYLAQDIVLVMQGGVSYRLQGFYPDYFDDAEMPGTKVRNAKDCLKLRQGNYVFSSPQVTESILLSAKPNKVEIDAKAHNGIYVLKGQSSTYDIHLVSNCIIRLSTPGALAKTADASTWNLYTASMSETIRRDDIQLISTRLQVGSASIELPDIDDDVPVDTLSVVTTAGNIYEVSLLFEVVVLYLIDARGYASVEALLADIQAHKMRNELAARVRVINIGFKQGSVGTVVYHSPSNHWSIDAEPNAPITFEELTLESAVDTL